MAELVASPPTVLKIRGSNLVTNQCFIRGPIIQINDGEEVSKYAYVSYGFGTSNHFEMVECVEVCLHFESSNRSWKSLQAGPVGYRSAHGNIYQQTNEFTTIFYEPNWANSHMTPFRGWLLDHMYGHKQDVSSLLR
jgi:hypothetical protein